MVRTGCKGLWIVGWLGQGVGPVDSGMVRTGRRACG